VEVGVKGLLSGWQEIAKYIRTHISTAQRCERQHGLPVHRRGKGPKAPVFALQTELDDWMRRLGRERVQGNLLDASGQHSNLSLSTDQVLQTQVIDRIHALTDLTLYRRNYQMDFDLHPTREGVRINIGIEFELANASNENQPYSQEFTIDHHEHGQAREMSVFKNGKGIYILPDPPPSDRTEGYVIYRGKKLMIEPESTGVRYDCRSSWIINRKKHDLWPNAMALPTLGVSVKTHAPPEYIITPSFSRSDLMLRDEHFNISWEPRK
jgi:hypothetical protein